LNPVQNIPVSRSSHEGADQSSSGADPYHALQEVCNKCDSGLIFAKCHCVWAKVLQGIMMDVADSNKRNVQEVKRYLSTIEQEDDAKRRRVEASAASTTSMGFTASEKDATSASKDVGSAPHHIGAVHTTTAETSPKTNVPNEPLPAVVEQTQKLSFNDVAYSQVAKRGCTRSNIPYSAIGCSTESDLLAELAELYSDISDPGLLADSGDREHVIRNHGFPRGRFVDIQEARHVGDSLCIMTASWSN
jgi:hypothetical protein